MRQGRLRRWSHALAAVALAALAVPGAASAAFPGTPGQILYVCAPSLDEEATVRLCAVNPDGSGNRPLVDAAGSPAWSPDGVHYAYTKTGPSELPGANPKERIHISNINGGSAIRRLEPERRAFSPAWAPDGLRLTYVDEGPGGGDSSDIFVTDLENRRRNLTTGVTAEDTDPAWSPDGRRIAFSSNREDQRPEIYVVDVTSGAITRLTRSTANNGSAESPSWSPDGTKIAFVRSQSSVDVEPEGRASDVYVINADGSGERPVTNHFGAGERNVDVRSPAWSPDGTRVAFTFAGQEENESLRIVNADGSGETSLGVTGYEPDWGPAAGSGGLQPLAAPRLSGLRLGRRGIWTAQPGVVKPTSLDGMPFKLRMSSAGYIRMGVQRVVRGRPRGKPIVAATVKARAGSSRLRWLGIYERGVEVVAGTYRLVLIPFNPLGDVGRTVNSRQFRVLGTCLERRRRPCRFT